MAKEIAIVFVFNLQSLHSAQEMLGREELGIGSLVMGEGPHTLQRRDSGFRLRLQPPSARLRILPARVSRLNGRRARLCGVARASTPAALVGGTILSAVGYCNDWDIICECEKFADVIEASPGKPQVAGLRSLFSLNARSGHHLARHVEGSSGLDYKKPE
ncbi:hypothetical protein CSAL01_13652 [Colletotrichum salicis]|uniref:Uncharacterized protein n=1 Tax=Colletotrichum salicis TaxID=1209931 RepID=A0A135V0X5_9PEZI|nr:hypothetical protein CSAL01_13652 [Colletotrichum salicis]